MSIKDFQDMLNRADVKEAEFEVLFQNSLVGVCYIAPDGTFLKVNPKFAEMLGYSRKELEGKKTWTQLTHPDDVSISSEEMMAVQKGEQVSYIAHKRYLSKEGTSVYCEVQVNRVEGEDEVFVHFLKQVQEISLPDSNLAFAKDRNGKPYLQPIVPVQEFLLRNWKWVLGTVGSSSIAFFGWAGNTASNYYEVKAKYEVQQEQLKRLQEHFDHLKPTK